MAGWFFALDLCRLARSLLLLCKLFCTCEFVCKSCLLLLLALTEASIAILSYGLFSALTKCMFYYIKKYTFCLYCAGGGIIIIIYLCLLNGGLFIKCCKPVSHVSDLCDISFYAYQMEIGQIVFELVELWLCYSKLYIITLFSK